MTITRPHSRLRTRRANRTGASQTLRRAVTASAFTLVLSSVAAAQCAMCRTALTNSPEGQRWARGIDHGIVLLLAAPFLIAGRVLFSIYRPEITAALSAVNARCRAAILRLHRVSPRLRAPTGTI